MLRFDKATFLSLFFKFTSFERLGNNLSGSDVLLFSEFTNIVSILFYNFIKFIMLLHTFLLVSFARYNEYMISLISFSKFQMYYLLLLVQKLLVIFEGICLGLNILIFESSGILRLETLATRNILGIPFHELFCI